MPDLAENELAAKSQEFRDFYKSLHIPDHRDGPPINISALLALSGEERTQAENLLIEAIEGTGGPVIEALAEMKSQRAATVLKEYAKRARGSNAVEVALALWKIEQWPHAQKMLIKVLEGRLKYFSGNDLDDFEARGRAAAARALAHMPGPQTTKALVRALDDPNDLVRYWTQIALNVINKK